MDEAASYVESIGKSARRASDQLVTLDPQAKVAALKRMATAIRDGRAKLLEANAKDITAAQEAGLAPALVERLKLNDKRIAAMADGVDQIADQPEPVGETIETKIRPDGLR